VARRSARCRARRRARSCTVDLRVAGRAGHALRRAAGRLMGGRVRRGVAQARAAVGRHRGRGGPPNRRGRRLRVPRRPLAAAADRRLAARAAARPAARAHGRRRPAGGARARPERVRLAARPDQLRPALARDRLPGALRPRRGQVEAAFRGRRSRPAGARRPDPAAGPEADRLRRALDPGARAADRDQRKPGSPSTCACWPGPASCGARREGYYILYSVDLDRVSTLSEVVLLFLAESPQDTA
jgi:hypothetical protein